MRDDLQRYACELADVVQNMPFRAVAAAAEMLLACHRRGGTIFVMGNGGSAATASHFACDLAKGTRADGIPPFRVIPLTDNVPLLTAWGNDTQYDRIFAEQLVNLVRAGDSVVLISASGSSPNVVAAAEAAHGARADTIALTGRSGGQLRDLVDLVVRVPSDCIEQVEDAHLAIAHGICVALRNCLRSGEDTPANVVPLPRTEDGSPVGTEARRRVTSLPRV
ncbi:MAG TPA: SIS domain-containing protein [Chloroflexota bacterium]|nr:SIS domain-containing protein [Chloroflexota bacterium]